jgi:hypothetical protein
MVAEEGCESANPYRTDLLPFLLDVFDFIIDQLDCARSGDDRPSAIDAASGVVPLLRSRAWENNIFGTMIALSPLEIYTFSPHWREHWSSLAKEPFDQFGRSADALIQTVNTVKDALRQTVNSP